jgi:hypothetical protein
MTDVECDTVLFTDGDQMATIYKEPRVVDAFRCPAGNALRDLDCHHPRESRVGDGVDHECTSRSKHPACLANDAIEILDVFEYLASADDVGDAVSERYRGDVASDREHRVTSGLVERTV